MGRTYEFVVVLVLCIGAYLGPWIEHRGQKFFFMFVKARPVTQCCSAWKTHTLYYSLKCKFSTLNEQPSFRYKMTRKTTTEETVMRDENID